MTANLQERLRAALHQPVRKEVVASAASVTALADLSALGGRWFESADGPGYVIESVYEAGYVHGAIPLHRALALDMPHLAGQCRDERIAGCAPTGLVYVDTESTGLGGAGAMVFLAGVARFDGSVLRLRQYLLPAPEHEGGLLGGLGRELDRAAALVSYNGKSFDVPLLETRYILSRRRPVFRSLPHVDLLHPNRRLFRGDLESHRLTVMERDVLGFEREADCPSAEVPERYFRFLRTGDPTHILPVLRHNAWDVLSLVALAVHLGAICAGEDQPLRAGRAAAYTGNAAAALRYYTDAAGASIGRGGRLEAIEGAARAAMRLADWPLAARWWAALVDEPRSRRITPYVELAKIQEHRLADPAVALATADRALDLARRGLLPQGRPGSEATIAALEHRRARLLRRAGRHSSEFDDGDAST